MLFTFYLTVHLRIQRCNLLEPIGAYLCSEEMSHFSVMDCLCGDVLLEIGATRPTYSMSICAVIPSPDGFPASRLNALDTSIPVGLRAASTNLSRLNHPEITNGRDPRNIGKDSNSTAGKDGLDAGTNQS